MAEILSGYALGIKAEYKEKQSNLEARRKDYKLTEAQKLQNRITAICKANKGTIVEIPWLIKSGLIRKVAPRLHGDYQNTTIHKVNWKPFYMDNYTHLPGIRPQDEQLWERLTADRSYRDLIRIDGQIDIRNVSYEYLPFRWRQPYEKAALIAIDQVCDIDQAFVVDEEDTPKFFDSLKKEDRRRAVIVLETYFEMKAKGEFKTKKEPRIDPQKLQAEREILDQMLAIASQTETVQLTQE